MNVHLIPARDLDASQQSTWRTLQCSNPDLASPYFAPEFTMSVAAVRADAEVAVIEDGGRVVAFLPFERRPGSIGVPVGGLLSDYQGFVCGPEFDCDPRDVIRQCRLAAWDFDHLVTSQQCFSRFHRQTEPSPQLDVSNGYAEYVETKQHAGSRQFLRLAAKARHLEQECGALRFVAHDGGAPLLAQTLAWKAQQYRDTGKPDLLSKEWIRALLEHIVATQCDGFSGMLSLLYAGDQLVAAHLGMRSRTVWHYWFPVYDARMARFSPGLLLLLKMAEHAPSLGLRVIDLGKGMSQYKERFMNASAQVASGSVEVSALLSLRRAARSRLRAAALQSPLAGPARRLVRWARGESSRSAL